MALSHPAIFFPLHSCMVVVTKIVRKWSLKANNLWTTGQNRLWLVSLQYSLSELSFKKIKSQFWQISWKLGFLVQVSRSIPRCRPQKYDCWPVLKTKRCLVERYIHINKTKVKVLIVHDSIPWITGAITVWRFMSSIAHDHCHVWCLMSIAYEVYRVIII